MKKQIKDEVHDLMGKKIKKKKKDIARPLKTADLLRRIHEMEANQLELQKQNEKLEQARAEAEEAYRQYTNLYDFAPVGYFTLARDGTVRKVNLPGADLLGVDRVNLINRRLGVFVSDASRPLFNSFLEKLLSHVGREVCELEFLKHNGGLLWARIEATCFEGGEECRTVMVDISGRKQAEEALKASERKYRLLHESMIDGFVSVDMEGKFLDCNEIYRNMLGYSVEELAQLTYKDITPEKWRALEDGIVENQIKKRGYSDIYEKEYSRKDGSVFPVELHTVLLWDVDGEPAGMWAIVRDITKRKQAEQMLKEVNLALQATLEREKQLARTDPLTGINNRRRLFEMAEHEFEVAARYQHPLAVMMYDIDHFKRINDIFTHAVGDLILQRITQIVCNELRSADVIGRYGGEEFIVILPMTNAPQAFLLAERIRMNVADLRMDTAKGKAAATLSIGIVELDGDRSAETVEDIFRRADEAMYAAKQTGRNRTEIR